jgi:hypothetical protein
LDSTLQPDSNPNLYDTDYLLAARKTAMFQRVASISVILKGKFTVFALMGRKFNANARQEIFGAPFGFNNLSKESRLCKRQPELPFYTYSKQQLTKYYDSVSDIADFVHSYLMLLLHKSTSKNILSTITRKKVSLLTYEVQTFVRIFKNI